MGKIYCWTTLMYTGNPEFDLEQLYSLRASMEISLRYFGNPMSGGMLKHSPLVEETLRAEIQNCDTRIRNILADMADNN